MYLFSFRPWHAMLFIFLISALNAWYNTTLPLYIDEAYYWLWSKYPSLSYLDHPPMVAWLIKLFTSGSDAVFFIRLSTVVCMALSAGFVYLLAKEVYDPETASLSAWLFTLLPATQMGYSIVTPDSPLILFWSMALYYAYKAFRYERWLDYIMAGIAIGLALLSKYTAILFLGVLFLFLVFKMPKKLLQIKPWIALFIAFILFSPVLIWNAQNEWISFTFQYRHGTGEAWVIHWKDFFEFFGGQFLTYSPVFFILLLWASVRYKEWWYNPGKTLLAISFLFPMLFILYKGLWTRMELNWAIIAFVGAIPLTAAFIVQKNLIKTAQVGILLCVILAVGMKYPLLFGLSGKNNPQNRIFGYKEMAHHLETKLKPGEHVFSDHLTRASILTYYLPGKPRVYIPTSTRISQYTYWDEGMDYSGMKGYYVSKDDRMGELQKIFGNVTRLPMFVAEKEGFKSREFHVYYVTPQSDETDPRL